MDGASTPANGSVRSQPIPTGFTPMTLAAVMTIAAAARAGGRDPARAARDMAWGLHPALPAALITDAVEHVLARI